MAQGTTVFVPLRMVPIVRERFNEKMDDIRRTVPAEYSSRTHVNVSVMMAALMNLADAHPDELRDAVIAIAQKKGSELT